MLRSVILAAARNERIESLVTNAPVSRSVVRRFVGGADTAAAVQTASRLVAGGLTVTLDHLGEDTTEPAQAQGVTEAYLELLAALGEGAPAPDPLSRRFGLSASSRHRRPLTFTRDQGSLTEYGRRHSLTTKDRRSDRRSAPNHYV